MTRKWQHYKHVYDETWLYSDTVTEQDTYISLQYDRFYPNYPWCVSWCDDDHWFYEYCANKSGAMDRVRELKAIL